MPDIFISYSSKDREQAQLLTELLASAGLSVWIDQARIGAATSWSGEISKAITDCKALIVLLSPSSVDSKNVTREVALAFERNKKILPIDLEPVSLPDDFAYHLAGIQRAPMSNIDSIIRALGKFGLEATGAPKAPKIIKESEGRKSLMILPFDDLSPTGDNQWFADGVVSELISTLANLKSLKISDAQETREFRTFHGQLTTYAREMQIQYFVQGDVRKFGDFIKISARLLDIESVDYLWQESLKGSMQEVFEIQEQVALKVAEGLRLHLNSEEKRKLAERGTENAEAYELFMKAHEYFSRLTNEGYELSIQLYSEAIRLDPNYALAYCSKANSIASIYQSFDRSPSLLAEAEWLCTEALRINPKLANVYYPLSVVYQLQGKNVEAEAAAQRCIQMAPEDFRSHFALAFFYNNTNEDDKAIALYEAALRVKPDQLAALYNLCTLTYKINADKCREWALKALPPQERYLRLHPTNNFTRMAYASCLFYAGRMPDARVVAAQLKQVQDGFVLFNTACLLDLMGDANDSLAMIRRAIDAGYTNITYLRSFFEDNESSTFQLAGTPEYEQLKNRVEQIAQDAKKNA
jgi:adenylate cyclase